MTRNDLVKKVSNELNITDKLANTIVLSTLNAITKGAVKDGKAVISGFGSFTVKDVKPKTIFCPSKQASLDIPAKRKVRFKPGKELRGMVNL